MVHWHSSVRRCLPWHWSPRVSVWNRRRARQGEEMESACGCRVFCHMLAGSSLHVPRAAARTLVQVLVLPVVPGHGGVQVQGGGGGRGSGAPGVQWCCWGHAGGALTGDRIGGGSCLARVGVLRFVHSRGMSQAGALRNARAAYVCARTCTAPGRQR